MSDSGGAPLELLPVASLSDYLVRVCPLLLGVDDGEFRDTLGVTVNQRILQDFLGDGRHPVLVVKKTTVDVEGTMSHPL